MTDSVEKILGLISSLSPDEKQLLFESLKPKGIPISAFNADISSLEIITKYLKEEENKSFKEISTILNRGITTIYNTYNNSKIKFKGSLDLSNTSVIIPSDIFTDRLYSILECIVHHLKDQKNLSFTEIASLLNKNYNTIKTVYRRYNIKKNG